MVEKVGLEALLGTDAFFKAISSYMSGIEKVNHKNTQVAAAATMAAKQQSQAYQQQSGSMNVLIAAAGAVTGPIQGITTAGLAMANVLGTLVTRAIDAVVGKVYELVSTGIMAAARVQELDYVLQILGQRSEFTKEQIDDQVQSIVDYGIRTDIAQDLVSQFIRFQLDLSKATDLARVAQDTAIISMVDSSEELNRILYGIKTYNTEVLRTAGLNINMQESLKIYARELGKTSDALTVTERQQAVMNAVLKEGARNAGLYEAAMEAPGKQLRSFSRDMWELGRVAGQMFLPAFGSMITLMRDVAKSWKTALDEGGKLYPLMQLLGTVASILGDAFSNMAKVGNEKLIEFLANITTTITGILDDAESWGVELVTNFAVGMINGATTALTVAINFITSMLTFWFKPGSPPKILPNVDNWGVATMNEYLKGFTQADFSILDSIQATMSDVFSLFTATGKMNASGVASKMKQITRLLSESIKTGSVGDLLNEIRSSAGEFGDQIATLVEKELSLVAAVNKVRKAEEELLAARKREYTANVKTNKLIEEYNNLLRKGASKEVLAAKLAEINASEQETQAAKESRIEAEKKAETASEGIDTLKEQVDLQRQLVKELMEAAKLELAAAKEAMPAAAGGGGKGAGVPTVPEIPGGEGTLAVTDAVTAAIDAAKAVLKAKWDEMWASLKEATAEPLARFREAWNQFTDIVGNVVDRIMNRVNEFGAWASAWWKDHGHSIKTIITKMWKVVTGIFDFFFTAFKEGWRVAGDNVMAIVHIFIDWIKDYFRLGFEALGQLMDILAAAMTGDWERMWHEIRKFVLLILEYVKTTFHSIRMTVDEAFAGLYNVGADAIYGLWQGIKDVWALLTRWLTEQFKKLPKPLQKALGMTSPSKVFADIGANMMKGLGVGIERESNVPIDRIANALSRTVGTASAASNSISNTVQMGGVSIYNDMDAVAFEARIRQVLSKTFQGNY